MRTPVIGATLLLTLIGIIGAMAAMNLIQGRANERIEEAIASHDDATVMSWMESNGDLNKRWYYDNTTKACLRRVFLRDEYWTTPLLFALNAGRFDLVRPLLKRGASVRDRDAAMEMAPIDYMPPTVGGNDPLDALSALLEYGANPNAERGHTGFTPLRRAIADANGPAVKILLAHGANPILQASITHARPLDSLNPNAPKALNLSIIKAFADAGVNLNQAVDGHTYLQWYERGRDPIDAETIREAIREFSASPNPHTTEAAPAH